MRQALLYGAAWHGEDITYIESPYSYMSITDFRNNIISIQNVYMGGIEGQRDDSRSLHNMVKGLDTDLDAKVLSAISNALAKIDAMPAPFALHYNDAANGEAVEACAALSETLDDLFTDPTGFFVDGDSRLPRYPHQKIWPYSDFVQHKLHMVNDIRTGWCRTTPLWGRGLAPICSGHADRLHDCRARNVIEAIMWHGSQQSDARRSVLRFRELPKADRDAIVKFIDAI